MDTTERETRDFMNVESFSQLPFIRPTPPVKEKGGAIRLFGKEFGGTTIAMTTDDHSDKNNNSAGEGEANKVIKSDSPEITSRKFECHYCCRNFPTSQALGGHQNAHKRERQHAKRAHLQSVMVHGGISDTHDHYGLINYSRLGSASALPMAYHSWNNSSSSYGANTRLYSSHGSYNAHQPQPINGSPLALWRIPSAHNSSPLTHSVPVHPQIPLFNSKDDPLKPLSAISSGLGSQSRFGCESKPSMQDPVSLDLRL